MGKLNPSWQGAKVVELTDQLSNQWDDQLVRQTFIPEDTHVILRIPICEHYEDLIDGNLTARACFWWRYPKEFTLICYRTRRPSHRESAHRVTWGKTIYVVISGKCTACQRSIIFCGVLHTIFTTFREMLKGLGWCLTQIVCYVIGFLRMVHTCFYAIRKSGKCGELATWNMSVANCWTAKPRRRFF